MQRSNIVIGAGPVGLAAALELVMHDSKHRNVVVFSDRAKYTRRQVIKLEKQDIDYVGYLISRYDMENLYKEKNIIRDYDRLRKHDVISLQTKNLEEMLYQQLQKYIDEGRVTIINTRESEQNIVNIDKFKHTVTLKNGREIPFDIMIAADGARRTTVSMLHYSEDFPIEYYPAQTDPLCVEHAVMMFKLPETMPKTSLKEDIITMDRVPARIPKEDMKGLNELGWTHQSPPEVRIFSNGDVFYVAAECSASMQTTPENREKWLREVLRTYLPKNEIDQLGVHVDDAGNPENYPLNIITDEANIPVFRFPKSLTAPGGKHSAYLVLLGDALRTTNYHTGSGALTGLREARELINLLVSKQTREDWIKYEKKLNELRDENRKRVEGFNAMRLAREAGQAINSTNQGIYEEHGPDRKPSLENYSLNEAFNTIGIDPNEFYVCDGEVAEGRLLEKYYPSNFGNKSREDEAREVIRWGLNGLGLWKRARTQNDFTTRIHDEKDMLLPGFIPQEEGESARGQWISMAYKIRGVMGPEYHFYKFRLAKQQGKLVAADVQHCELNIGKNGYYRLAIPGFAKNLLQQASLRLRLKLEIPCLQRAIRKEDKNEARYFINHGQNNLVDEIKSRKLGEVDQYPSYLGVANVSVELSSNKMDDALRFVHERFCTNPELSAETFVSDMREKIRKLLDGEEMRIKRQRALGVVW